MLSLMHDKPYSLFVNPYRFLYEAGIKAGQKVLEVGFGSGFFTILAAKIVGERGTVYALDINRAVVEPMLNRVKQKHLSKHKSHPRGSPRNGSVRQYVRCRVSFRCHPRFLRCSSGSMGKEACSKSEGNPICSEVIPFRDESSGVSN
jgi:SAM-dependent methyltransferase